MRSNWLGRLVHGGESLIRWVCSWRRVTDQVSLFLEESHRSGNFVLGGESLIRWVCSWKRVTDQVGLFLEESHRPGSLFFFLERVNDHMIHPWLYIQYYNFYLTTEILRIIDYYQALTNFQAAAVPNLSHLFQFHVKVFWNNKPHRAFFFQRYNCQINLWQLSAAAL